MGNRFFTSAANALGVGLLLLTLAGAASASSVVPPEAFSLHFSNLGDLGTSTVTADLLSTSDQVLCAEWTTVDITQ